jgi:hypothetical protein
MPSIELKPCSSILCGGDFLNFWDNLRHSNTNNIKLSEGLPLGLPTYEYEIYIHMFC